MDHGKLNSKEKKGILELRKRIEAANIPSSILDESINVATWNIREFGKRPRKDISINYIAEILYQFDLIAITELRDNLTDFYRVLKILGPNWDYVLSDHLADRGGNKERFCFLFDKRAVQFSGMAGELDAPRKKNSKGEYLENKSWWRRPYMASFKAGNIDFIMVAAHIRWGKNAKSRVEPLKLLAEAIHKRVKDKHTVDQDYIVLGDFNIPDNKGATFKAVTSKGLRVPEGLLGKNVNSNLDRKSSYDQILHYPAFEGGFSDNGGVLDFYHNVDGEADIKSLYPGSRLNKHKFTFELSDHLPLWTQILIDHDDALL